MFIHKFIALTANKGPICLGWNTFNWWILERDFHNWQPPKNSGKMFWQKKTVLNIKTFYNVGYFKESANRVQSPGSFIKWQIILSDLPKD